MRESKTSEMLRQAAADGLSGSVRLHVGESLIGQVLFVEGRVAWATSRDQRERLGTFLWRLGHITRAQLEIVERMFEAHHGRKKFGHLLEELGLMPRPILRRCLLLHTREAVRALLACHDAVPSRMDGALDVTEEMLFALEEVLPSREAPIERGTDRPPTRRASPPDEAGGDPLAPLFGIPGYVASAVVSSQGEVRTGHATDCGLDLTCLGIFASAVADGASRLAACGAIGTMEIATVGGPGGGAVMSWIDEDRRNLVVVLLGDPVHQGVARLAIEDARPGLRSWTDQASVATFFRGLVQKAETPQDQVRALKVAIRVRLRELRMEGRGDRQVERLEEALDLVNQGKLAEAAGILDDPETPSGAAAAAR